MTGTLTMSDPDTGDKKEVSCLGCKGKLGMVIEHSVGMMAECQHTIVRHLQRESR